MIKQEHGVYVLYCDRCGYEGGWFDTFDEAKQFCKNYDWETKREEGIWINVCDECRGWEDTI